MNSRSRFMLLIMAVLLLGAPFLLTANAAPDPNKVCGGTKVDAENLPATIGGVTITVVDEATVHFDIPDGTTVEVCVKAGSAKQGNGPEYLVLTADADVSHPSGKATSHVSVLTVTEPTPTPSPTVSPIPT